MQGIVWRAEATAKQFVSSLDICKITCVFFTDAHLRIVVQLDALQNKGLSGCETEIYVCDMVERGGFC